MGEVKRKAKAARQVVLRKGCVVQFRVRVDEVEVLKGAAKAAGVSLSEWLRERAGL